MSAYRFNSSLIRRPWKTDLRSFLAGLSLMTGLLFQTSGAAQSQSTSSNTWTVTIVLPARVVAGRPATLAGLGVDGRLASDVMVELEDGQRVATDASGRASFTAPSSGSVLIAKASGSSAAALVDSNPPENARDAIWAPATASLHEPFTICGSRFRSEADTNHVRLNAEPALVMAASQECLAVLPNSKALPGPAEISIQAPSGQWTAQTTLVALDSAFPRPALLPGQKGQLVVSVRGSSQPLRVVFENQTPGILHLLKGDLQELSTSGGAQNFAAVEVKAIRSGDFSRAARLAPSPDENAARRYLSAAASLAAKRDQHDIGRIAKQLERNPRNLDGLRRDLDRVLAQTIEGDLRTLLAAARTAL